VIIIAGTIDFKDNETRELAVHQSRALQEATRSDEAGCEAYYFGPDPFADHRIQVYELWADEPSLDAHFQHPNYRSMLALISELGIVATTTAKFRCDLSEPVYDETFTPRADFFTSQNAE
jgi:quinol monooxygenase YgiN